MPAIDHLRTVLAISIALAASSCSSEHPEHAATLLSFTPVATLDVPVGGISDLALDPADKTGLDFLGISDRGPNDPKSGTVFFPFPRYHQKVSRFRLDPDGSIRLVGTDSIRDERGRWTSGLPSPLFPATERAVAPGTGGETFSVAPDSAGFDFEGLAAAGRDTLWASEEYGPRIVRMHRDPSGGYRIEKTLAPGRGLPAVFARRAANKGLEALCRTPSGTIVAIFQGALANALAQSPEDVAERSLARRILSLRPATGEVRELVAQMPDDPGSKAKRRTRIGTCTALDDDRILVVEHRKKGKGRIEVDLVVWDLSRATDVHRRNDPDARGRMVGGMTIEEAAMSAEGMSKAGIESVERVVLAPDLTRSVGAGLSKPEGLVLLPGAVAIIAFDNDFATPANFFLKVQLPRLPF